LECGVPGPASDQREEVGEHSRGENERRFELQEPQFEWAEVRRNRQNRSIAFFAGRNSLSCFRTTILQKPFSDFGSSLQITPQDASIDPVAFLPSEQQNQRPVTKTPPRNPGGVLIFRLMLQG
jgi:hypothetical protein